MSAPLQPEQAADGRVAHAVVDAADQVADPRSEFREAAGRLLLGGLGRGQVD